MILYVVLQGVPVVARGKAAGQAPAVAVGSGAVLAQKGGVVHELLGNTANVDAGASDAPLGASGGGLDVVQNGNLEEKRRVWC